jgi:hydroxymethylbilane synthase
VGCRGTQFCKAQTAAILKRVADLHPELEFEYVDVPGNGDESPILDALGAGVCDLHVRGMRDVPLELPEDVVVAACTERNDPFDVLIAQDGALLEDLPDGAKVGLESARVSVQIGSFREDLTLEKMPGTVDEFLEALNAGKIAAFIVAAEDVETLGWEDAVTEVFPPDIILPAAGQGSFGLLTRKDDEATAALVQEVDHLVTRQVVAAERAFLRELNVKIVDPVAVHGSFEADTLVLEALLGDEVSGAILRDDLDGDPSEEDALGIRLAKLFVADGARDYLASYDS